MANLHKTERKLPWLVRDGGLPSDWLGGRIGGKFFAVTQSNLRGMPDTAAATHTHPHRRRSNLPFATAEQVKTKGVYQSIICLSREHQG